MCLQDFLQSSRLQIRQLSSSIFNNGKYKENEYRSNRKNIQSHRPELCVWLAVSWLLLCMIITVHICHLSLDSAFHIISHYYLNTNLVKPFHSFPLREQLCHLFLLK